MNEELGARRTGRKTWDPRSTHCVAGTLPLMDLTDLFVFALEEASSYWIDTIEVFPPESMSFEEFVEDVDRNITQLSEHFEVPQGMPLYAKLPLSSHPLKEWKIRVTAKDGTVGYLLNKSFVEGQDLLCKTDLNAWNRIEQARMWATYAPEDADKWLQLAVFGEVLFAPYVEPEPEPSALGSFDNPRMGAAEGWVVTQDGETVGGPFESDAFAVQWLFNRQGQSVDWAVRNEGYDIVLVRDGRVEWSYKEALARQDEEGPFPEFDPDEPTQPELGAVELVELGAGMPEDFYDDYELGAKVKKRTPLAKSKRIAAKVERWIKPYARRLNVAGSVRRKRPETGDIEFVILPKKSLGVEGLAEKLDDLGFKVGPSIRSAKKMVDGVKVEIYIVHDPVEYGAMMFMYTGDRTFNMAMRKKAMAMGYLLNQYGLWTRDKKRAILQSPDERDFFEALEVPYHTPQERSLKHRTSAERRKMKARQARMRGVMSGDEEAFFSRLESVWGDTKGE